MDDQLYTVPRNLTTICMPRFGAYIVFTLNAVATLEALEDPIATQQAKELPTKKYVGCVGRVVDLPSPFRRYHECSCLILSKGFPRPSPSEGAEETMCVPIAPAEHPEGRLGVTPFPALPWDNLYHHTLLGLRLRLPTMEMDHSHSPMLSDGDVGHLTHYFNADLDRSDRLIKEYTSTRTLPVDFHHASSSPTLSVSPILNVSPPSSPLSAQSAPTSPGLPIILEDTGTGFVDNDDDDDRSSIDEWSRSAESEAASDSLESLTVMMAQEFLDHEDPRQRFMPVTDISVDLASVTELADAQGLWEEIAAVKRIQAESEERSRARVEKLEQERLKKLMIKDESELEAVIPTPSDRPSFLSTLFSSIQTKSKLYSWSLKFPSTAPSKSSLTRAKSVVWCMATLLTLGCIPLPGRQSEVIGRQTEDLFEEKPSKTLS